MVMYISFQVFFYGYVFFYFDLVNNNNPALRIDLSLSFGHLFCMVLSFLFLFIKKNSLACLNMSI